MRNNRIRKGLVFGIVFLLVFVVFTGIPMNVSAEEPEFPEEPPESKPSIPEKDGWLVEGNGTYFEITNSSYLNITLTSSENVYVHLESVPEVVSYHIEADCNATTTYIKLTGFKLSKTYYRYQDGDLLENFMADVNGSYFYTQNISAPHHVFIQEMESTIYIRSDGSIDPSNAPINKQGSVFKMTANVYEPIVIQKSDITLDGNGYTVQGSGSGGGIYLNGMSGVTVQNLNVKGFSRGISLHYSDSNTISGNTFSSIRYYSICFYHSANSNTISGNTFSGRNWYHIYLASSHSNTISGNTVLDSDMGIALFFSNSNTISGNKVSGGRYCGIYLEFSSYNIITNCELSNNDEAGIYLYYSHSNTISGTTASGHYFGIYLEFSSYNIITNCDVFNNYNTGIDLQSSHSNTLSGNIVSDNIGCGVYLYLSGGSTLRDNTMTGNTFNFGVWGGYLQDIDTSNKVDGKPIYYWMGQSYKKVPANAGYVGIINSNNIIVQDLTLTNNGQGVLFAGTIDSTIQNVVVSGNRFGIYLRYSNSNTISGNTVSNNDQDGIYLQYSNSNIISGNTVSNNDQEGIYLRGSSSNTISGNTVSGNREGIVQVHSSSNTISGNTVSGSTKSGIRLDNSDSNTLSDNTVSDNTYGINLGNSDISTISGNMVSGNTYGIYLYNSNSNTIGGNTVSSNSYGIFLSGNFGYLNDNTIIGNKVSYSNYGIFLKYSSNTEIYHNNIIGNTNQVYTYQSTNTWDDGAGKGNYWSDYTGSDTNSDGVGDTDLPHQGLDYYPLMNQYTNTPAGTDVEVSPGDGVLMSFSEITTAGVTIADEVTGSPPANFKLIPTKTFYSITTTASYSGVIEISIPYDDTGISPAKEATLTLNVFNEATGIWEDITTYVDTVNNIIYAETTHLSIFAIMLRINEPPIAAITEPASGSIFEIESKVQFTATFTDEDSQNTHTAQWRFTSPSQEIKIEGTVTESGGSGSVSGSYIFLSQGIYDVTLIVIDDKGGYDITNSVDDLPAMVVIYDPEGGFVTGGGWINSPEGAYIPSTSLSGKASFGFVAKYKKGTTEPIGNTEFEFEVADFEFHSTDYEWLVVAGAKTQFKGTGTINDEGEYKFMIWATDGALVQGGGPDKFRIKIWEEDEFEVETVIYDNKVETEIGGGSIVIHKA